MKLKKQYCLLFSLVGLLSACSTATQNTDQSSSIATNEASGSETSLVKAESENSQTTDALSQIDVLSADEQEILRLKQALNSNQAKISDLNAQLDSQEDKINRLQTSQNSAKTARLVEIEAEKQKLSKLEADYINLQLENDELKKSLSALNLQNKLYKEQILAHNLAIETELKSNPETPVVIGAEQNVADVKQDLSIIGFQRDYDVLNKTHHTLLHKYNVLDKDYKALDDLYVTQQKQLDQLSKDYQELDESNKKAKTDYALLRQKNLDLGGAISDARAQQQTLWDQIQVKNKVIETLEADNSALREKSTNLNKITSGQLTTALPVADNALELGTLNAKVLVLESEIFAQQKLLSEYQDKLTNLEQSDDKSDLKNIEIARLGQDLTDLNAEHKELAYQFEQLELAQAVSRDQQHQLRQTLTAAEANVLELTAKKQQLESELSEAKAELISLQGRYEESLLALESAKETRQSLENQLSDLIELEAISAGFKGQLATSLSNVRWQIPKQIELGTSFEIILTANADDAIAGQVFIAELISDSSLELISSISAEAQPANGQLQWRWRAKGVSESLTAQVNLFIHQDIQYQEDRVLKEVYRDQKILSLVNDNLFEKYGFWVIAIFAGLMGGFIIGKLNKTDSAKV